MQKTKTLQLIYFLFTLPLLASADSVPQPLSPPVNYSLLPPDAIALLEFKSRADLYNHLPFISHKRYDYCYWLGVKCSQGRVVGLILQRLRLGGSFEPDTLTRLDQLRVLTLQNTSLTGPIPDLSQLTNLKALFLNSNSFSGNIPLSIATLHRLAILDISHNNLTGPIPTELIRLDRIYSLHFELNQLNGTIPPFNQSLLQVFNVSGNNLTGTIPVTPTLSKFNWTSFSLNPGLCGEIIGRNCGSKLPFFNPAEHAWPPRGNQQVHVFPLPKKTLDRGKKPLVILGFTVATLITIGFVTAWLIARRKRKKKTRKAIVVDIEEENETRKAEVRKSGNLIFCAGEPQDYNVEELMRGSAEMLGRGTIGTSYKAVLDNQVVVCVKRLDVDKNAVTSGEMFERHVEMVGRLRHPNLVPLRAYFQAKQERLLIYDYQSNGSIFSLVHGLRSTRAKPLHWTSCLKIAEDIAQGLAYIHQIPNLVHGNLKATNVLLGADFEARLTDYCLTVLTRKFHAEDADDAGYAAPEILNFIAQGPCFTTKSDIYSFGVLLMELLTSKPPSQHPYLVSRDVLNWVRQVREQECSGEDNRLEMLVNLASTCSRTSPELRPTIWLVLEMIQEIKEIVTRESDSSTTFFF